MIPTPDFESRIDSLDLSLFEMIQSQTAVADKESLLAVQRATRKSFGQYVYLEIGSHIGGSIQPHLLDPCCHLIYSIDNRPYSQPDERGIEQIYPENSTDKMLEHLRAVAPDNLHKIVCFESLAEDIDPQLIVRRPHICFIDGEHTDRAAVSDFEFCLSVTDPNGVIVFHDSDLVSRGIRSIIDKLRRREIDFRGMKLGGSVYVIGLGASAVIEDDEIRRLTRHAGLYFLKSRLRLGYKRYRNRRRVSERNALR
ncbi:MAG: class I SAM-dependent methyltransferase [Blastocatellia bacterium]|nr:class I SAM-dependent methyltransferase [Blastocatellia bacterium]